MRDTVRPDEAMDDLQLYAVSTRIELLFRVRDSAHDLVGHPLMGEIMILPDRCSCLEGRFICVTRGVHCNANEKGRELPGYVSWRYIVKRLVLVLALLPACQAATPPSSGYSGLAVRDWGGLDCAYWGSVGEAMMMAYQARFGPDEAIAGLRPEVADRVLRPDNIETFKQVAAGVATYEFHNEPRARMIAIASYRDNVRSQCEAAT